MAAEFASTWLAGLATFVLSAVACTLLELLAAAEKQSWLSRVRSLLFWSILIAATTAIVLPVRWLVRYAEIEPLLSLDFRSATSTQDKFGILTAYAVLPFAPYFLFDCFYYWFHRLQHAVPFLWQFHAVHHSIEELNAANCYHHASEALFRLPFVIMPLMLVIDIKVPEVFIITTVLTAWGQFVHSNTRISFGPFDRLLASPRFHRIHHSLAPEHRDKNFASFFPILDVLFRTAYFPPTHEIIRTGLAGQREPRTLRQYLFPLSSRENKWRVLQFLRILLGEAGFSLPSERKATPGRTSDRRPPLPAKGNGSRATKRRPRRSRPRRHQPRWPRRRNRDLARP
jgi:sterol desaturase/sphingolipid hydroxylase (fatty acid hydroxylase superfamily)